MPQCDICHLAFTTDKGLIMHRVQKHKETIKKHICKFCNKQLARIFFLQRHEACCKSNPANAIKKGNASKNDLKTEEDEKTPQVINNTNYNNTTNNNTTNNNTNNNNTTVNAVNNVTIVVSENQKDKVLKNLVPITNDLLKSLTHTVIQKTNGYIKNGYDYGVQMMNAGLQFSVVCTDAARNKIVWRNGDQDEEKIVDPSGLRLAQKAQVASAEQIRKLLHKHLQYKKKRIDESFDNELDQLEEQIINGYIDFCSKHLAQDEENFAKFANGLTSKPFTYESFVTKEQRQVEERTFTKPTKDIDCYFINCLKSLICVKNLLNKSPFQCGQYIVKKIATELEMEYDDTLNTAVFFYMEAKKKVMVDMKELIRWWNIALHDFCNTQTIMINRFSGTKKIRENFMNHLAFKDEGIAQHQIYCEMLYKGFLGIKEDQSE
jgi:hypothetical protein